MVRGTFSPAGARWPAAGARLPRTLGFRIEPLLSRAEEKNAQAKQAVVDEPDIAANLAFSNNRLAFFEASDDDSAGKILKFSVRQMDELSHIAADLVKHDAFFETKVIESCELRLRCVTPQYASSIQNENGLEGTLRLTTTA